MVGLFGTPKTSHHICLVCNFVYQISQVTFSISVECKKNNFGLTCHKTGNFFVY